MILHDFALLLPGGGSSSRFGNGNKLLRMLDDLPVFLHAVRTLGHLFPPGRILMAVPHDQIPVFEQHAKQFLPEIPIRFISGGNCRAESVHKLTIAAGDDVTFVAIHDAARPLIGEEEFLACAEACRSTGAALLCHQVTDTIKMGNDSAVVATVPREDLFAAETPQMFERTNFLDALSQAAEEHYCGCTDDSCILEQYSTRTVRIVENTGPNPKVTRSADLAFCQTLLDIKKSQTGT